MTRAMQRILIFRLGSIGDTVAALPALHLIARAYPDAERRLLSQSSEDLKAAPISEILSGSSLVHGYIRYPLGMRAPGELIRVRRQIRAFRPDLLVYLAEPRGLLKTYRDAAFFRWCGIRRMVGVPYLRDLQHHRRLEDGSFEFEGSRLLRCLRALGASDIDADGAFDLGLAETERKAARSVLGSFLPTAPILAVSIGAKVDANDWGDANWSALFDRMQAQLSSWSLVMLGAAVERERSDRLLASWPGPKMNLCGATSVRESAAVLERARVFVGHDSGPVHLAAAVGTPCVAIFSSRNLPGEWFPHGRQHRVLYSDVPCRGCRLEVCDRYGKMCIASITVDDVAREIELALAASAPRSARPDLTGRSQTRP